MVPARRTASVDRMTTNRKALGLTVRTLSDVLGISPRDTQAAVWIAYRGRPD